MTKINFKKVLSFLMALCMIMSIFTCVSILPASAAKSKYMIEASGNKSSKSVQLRNSTDNLLKSNTTYIFRCNIWLYTLSKFGITKDELYGNAIDIWYYDTNGTKTAASSVADFVEYADHYDTYSGGGEYILYTAKFTLPELRQNNYNLHLYLGDYNGNSSSIEFALSEISLVDKDGNEYLPAINADNYYTGSIQANGKYRGSSSSNIKVKDNDFPNAPEYFEFPEEEPETYDDGDAKIVRFTAGAASALHYYNENRVLKAGDYEFGFDYNIAYGEDAYVKLIAGGNDIIGGTFGAATDYKYTAPFTLDEDAQGIEIVIGNIDVDAEGIKIDTAVSATSMYIANPYIKKVGTASNLINNITESTFYPHNEKQNYKWNRDGGNNTEKIKTPMLLDYNEDVFNGSDISKKITFGIDSNRYLKYHDYYDSGIEEGKTYKIVLDYRQFSKSEDGLEVDVKFDSTLINGNKEIDTVNRKLYYTFTATESNPYNFNISIGNINVDKEVIASIGHVAMYEVDADGNIVGSSLIDDINAMTLDTSSTATKYDRVWNTLGSNSVNKGIYIGEMPEGYFSANIDADNKMVHFPAGQKNGYTVLVYEDVDVYMPAGTYKLEVDINKIAGDPTFEIRAGGKDGTRYYEPTVTNEGNHYTYTFVTTEDRLGVSVVFGNLAEANNMSAIIKCPTLYRVDENGVAVTENLVEPINSNTTVVKTKQKIANAVNLKWTTVSYIDEKSSETGIANIYIKDIDENYFNGDVVTTGTDYMAIFQQGQNWKVIEYNDSCLTLVEGQTYVLTIDQRDVTGDPTVALYDTKNKELSNIDNGYVSAYEDVTEGNTRTITFTMSKTLLGVRIRVGNYSDDKDVSAKFANIKLVEENSETNLIAGFTDLTFCSESNKQDRKWAKVKHNNTSNICTYYLLPVPEGYYDNPLTDKMFYISEIKTSAVFNPIVMTGATVEPEKTYSIELDWKANAGLDPAIRVEYKHTYTAYVDENGEEVEPGTEGANEEVKEKWSSIAPDMIGESGHYKFIYTMPADTVTNGYYNLTIGVGADMESSSDPNYGRGSVYFGNFSLKEVKEDGSYGVNILVNSDLKLADEGNVADGAKITAWSIKDKTNSAGTKPYHGGVKILEQPAGFFTSEGAEAQKMVTIDGGDYDYLRQKLFLKSGTTYRLTYKVLFVNADSSAVVRVYDSSGDKSPTYISSDYDLESRTQTIVFKTLDEMRATQHNAMISFYIGRNGYDVELSVTDVKLYEVNGENTVGGNLINNGGFYFGESAEFKDVEKLASADSKTTDAVEFLGWYFYGKFGENVTYKVTDIPENYFASAPKYAERLVNIRKILLTVKNPTSNSVYEDVNEDGSVDVRDLIATKEAAANNFAANGADNDVKAWKAEHLTGSNATAEELYQGTKYYIDAENGKDTNSGTSPEDAWQSLTKAASVRSGNTVLFKAGQTFRNTSINSGIFDDKASAVLTTKSGVTYGAYGEGAKPVLSGSAYNYADKNSVSWSNDGNGIWKTGVNNSSAGIVVYNGGELIGNMTVSKAALATAQDGDFYHDGNYIYVKSSTGNPADKWNDIEIGVYRSVIDLSEGVTIDNIAVMYTGYHGMESSATESNITITNCVVSYIGGSVMKGTRLGNGIQFGISGSNLTVENCYVSECYDAGLTFQTWSGEGNGYWINLTFKNNLVENCHYSFEWFGIGTEGSNEGTEIKNISVDSNIFVGAGYGWSYDEREDFGASSIQVSHFRGGSNKSYYKNMSNFQFTNNILDGSKKSLVYWYWTHETEAEITSENFSASGNSFYQRSGCDDYILNYKDQPLLNGCSRGKVREALEKFEATTTPTGNAEFIYDDQVVILK